MGDAPIHGLLIAASLSITCTLIALGIFLMHSGESVANTFSERLNTMNTNLSAGNLTKYDHTVVKGTDVVNCIRQNRGDVAITVKKLCGNSAMNLPMFQTYDRTLASFVNTPADAVDDTVPDGTPVSNVNADGKIYINPNADFIGTLSKNANGVITSLLFEQVSFVSDATTVPQENTTIIINNGGVGGAAGDMSAIASALEQFQQNVENIISGQLNSNESVLAETNANLAAALAGLSGESGILQEIRDLIIANAGINPSPGDESTGAVNDLDTIMMKLNEIYSFIQTGGLDPGELGDTVTMNELIQNLKTCNTTMGNIKSTMSVEHQAMIQSLSKLDQDQATRFGQLNQKVDGLTNNTTTLIQKIDTLTSEVVKMTQALGNAEAAIKNNVESTYIPTYPPSSTFSLQSTIQDFKDTLNDSEYNTLVTEQYAGAPGSVLVPYMGTISGSEELNSETANYNAFVRVYDTSSKINFAHESIATLVTELEKLQKL